MAIEISTRFDETITVALAAFPWTKLVTQSSDGQRELEQSVVYLGNQACRFGDLFACKWCKDSAPIVWQGRTQNVNGIGQGLDAADMIVEGDAGDYLGLNLKSGRIDVGGNVGNWLGVDNRGGEIHVSGNCGDFAVAALPGKSHGGNGATVTIGGDAGEGLGLRMRRGVIAVAGDVGDVAACEMLAGTVIIGGKIRGHLGNQMKRGTIICKQIPQAGVGLGFNAGYQTTPQAWPLISRFLQARLKMEWLPPLNAAFKCFHGDTVHKSRGELWIAD